MLKVYITDLAAYNNGYLIGQWFTLPMEQEELSQAITEVLQLGSSTICEVTEEWFITDYEWEEGIELCNIDEYENLDRLNEQLQEISDATTSELQAMEFLLSQGLVNDIKEAYKKCDEVTVYENQTMEEVATELIESCYNLDDIPAIITNNIDYKAIANELEIDGDYTVSGNDVYEYRH